MQFTFGFSHVAANRYASSIRVLLRAIVVGIDTAIFMLKQDLCCTLLPDSGHITQNSKAKAQLPE